MQSATEFRRELLNHNPDPLSTGFGANSERKPDISESARRVVCDSVG